MSLVPSESRREGKGLSVPLALSQLDADVLVTV